MLIEEEFWIQINRGVSSGERQTQKTLRTPVLDDALSLRQAYLHSDGDM